MDLFKKKLVKKETCLSCHDFLANVAIRSTCKLIESVNQGFLVHPSSNVNLVVKITNSCFEEFNRKTKILQEKSIVQKIQNNVIEILNARHPKLFESLDLHVDNQRLDNCVSHRVLMIKKIILCYLSLRLKHFCKLKNETELDKRMKRKATKLVHFKSQ